MAVSEYILPPVISSNPHLRAFIDSADTILKQNDLTVLLVYIIDTAPLSVLPYLAGQFGVLGAGGWQHADTEEKQRALLKRGLELNRYKGTVFAIKEALKISGFGNSTITEGAATGGEIAYNGVYLFDGNLLYNPDNHIWAFFSIEIELNGQPNNAETLAKAKTLINEYKNTRSTLVQITFI